MRQICDLCFFVLNAWHFVMNLINLHYFIPFLIYWTRLRMNDVWNVEFMQMFTGHRSKLQDGREKQKENHSAQ